MKVKITIKRITKENEEMGSAIIIGDLNSTLSQHDTVAAIFALEFAANNYTDFPIRVHIEEIPV